MIEIEGMIIEQYFSIIIDLGANLSYVSPQIVEKCNLKLETFQQAWLEQLATGTKRKVTHKHPKTTVNLNGYETEIHLNILPLGSYDILVGMDQLDKKEEIMNFLDKTVHGIDNEGRVVIVKGKPKTISIRTISALHLKMTTTKGCQVYDVQVEESGQQTEE